MSTAYGPSIQGRKVTTKLAMMMIMSDEAKRNANGARYKRYSNNPHTQGNATEHEKKISRTKRKEEVYPEEVRPRVFVRQSKIQRPSVE